MVGLVHAIVSIEDIFAKYNWDLDIVGCPKYFFKALNRQVHR